MYVATIELETDTDYWKVSGPDGDFGAEGAELDQTPKGMFSTAFTTRTISGAYQIGGRAVGHEIPIRAMTLPFNLYDMGAGIEDTVSRFLKMWRMGQTVTWKYTTAISGTRWLKLRLSQQIEFSPKRDWNLDGYARAVVSAIALQPMYESDSDNESWSNPSAGTHTGWLTLSNPTDQDMYLEWSIDPATSWAFPDFSFGNEKKWRRPAGADDDRMIVTPVLTQKLSVMADPDYDTYISEDLSNAAGLFNGVEPMYFVPAYTEPIEVPVICNGPADSTITMTMRRLWSAEGGLE
jgi:hypothetical protein